MGLLTRSQRINSHEIHTQEKKGTKKCSNSGTPKEMIARGVFFLSLPSTGCRYNRRIDSGWAFGQQASGPSSLPLHSSRKTDNNKNNMWRSPPVRSISRHSLNRKKKKLARVCVVVNCEWRRDNYVPRPSYITLSGSL